MIRNALAVVALIGLSLSVFQRVGRNEFLGGLEEVDLIHNTPVSAGFEGAGLRWAWSTTRGGTYQPLSWTSHALAFGMLGNDGGSQHLVSAVLHAIAAGLFFLAFVTLSASFWTSFLAAALFGLHPLAVEAVSFPPARGLVLGAVFLALTLALYAEHARRPAGERRPSCFWLALFCFVLGLLAHPAVAVFGLVVMVLPLPAAGGVGGGAFRPPLGERLAFLVPGLLAGGIALVLASPAPLLTPGQRFGGGLAALGHSVSNTVLPTGLAGFYPHPALVGGASWGVSSLLPLVLFALATGFAIALRSRAEKFFAGWMWFVFFLVAAPLLVPRGEAFFTDRSLYLALPGLGLAIASLCTGGAQAKRMRTALGSIAGLALAVFFGVTSWKTIGFWKNDITLNARAVGVTERNDTAHLRLARGLAQLGMIEKARNQAERALAIRDTPKAHLFLAKLETNPLDRSASTRHLENALEVQPDSVEALIDMGRARIAGGKSTEALEYFERAAARGARGFHLEDGRGAALVGLDRIPEAIAAFRRSLEDNPRGLEARLNLAPLLFSQGMTGADPELILEAEEMLEKAIEYHPENAQALSRLGLMAQERGLPGKAIGYYKEVVELNPNDFAAQFTLGSVYLEQNRYQEALEPINVGLRTAPQAAFGYVLFGDAYAGLGDPARALNAYGVAIMRGASGLEVHGKIAKLHEEEKNWAMAEEAHRKSLACQPDSWEAQYNVAQMMSRQAKIPEAIEEFQKALALDPRSFLTHCNLGHLYETQGNLTQALVHYRGGVETEQPPPEIADRLAWILATNTDETLRSGEEALRLAQYAVRATAGSQPLLLEGLAAALAETGDFSGALKAQKRALSAYGANASEAARARLESYRAGRPHRQARGRL